LIGLPTIKVGILRQLVYSSTDLCQWCDSLHKRPLDHPKCKGCDMARPGTCGFLNYPDFNREDKPLLNRLKGNNGRTNMVFLKLIISVKSLEGTPYENFEDELAKCVKYRRLTSKRLRTCKCDIDPLSVLRTNYNAHHPSLIPCRIV
jgi:hypothetical protein